MPETCPPGWMPLSLLCHRFDANIAALAGRDPNLAAAVRDQIPAEPYFLRSTVEQLELAVGGGEQFRILPTKLGAPAASAVMKTLCPSGKATEALLVAGEDQGWLWNGIYQLPAESPYANAHRPPLYFLIDDLERFRVLLHVQDWQSLLADERVRLFVGTDFADQLASALVSDRAVPWPASWVTVGGLTWPEGKSLQSIVNAARDRQTEELNRLAVPDKCHGQEVLDRIRSGRPLRIMGLTSRYTTFIQHSMRDWLAAFESLGHTTNLQIEAADHQFRTNLATAQACRDFQPDLIVAIDHCRRSLSGVPDHVPVVMWVQDKLANIYDPATGKAQGPLDFVLGYGRLELAQNFHYPAQRFMPTMMATNESRFSPSRRPVDELEKFRCDVSYVSHASTTAETFLQRAKAALPQPKAWALFDDLYGQLRSIYDAGESVSSGDAMHAMIRQTLQRRCLKVDVPGLFELVAHRLNNAMFRQQALQWIGETGCDLRLYGRGWEKHPTLAKYARGEADNVADLHAIYQASAINLQVTPFGAVHQRLLDGLAAGGFFLMRSVTADELELLRRTMWNWCQARGIKSGKQMLARVDAEWLHAAERYTALGATDPRVDPDAVFGEIEECAMTGFTRTPQTLFENAGAVTFSNRVELLERVERFLKSPADRVAIARSMRERVVQSHTYRGITKRLVEFVQIGLPEMTSMRNAA